MPCLVSPAILPLRPASRAAAPLLLLALIPPAARLYAQDVTVNYTGRLFGYYRIEATEPLDHGNSAKLSAVRFFLDKRADQKAKGPAALLLGMGDNFAPEFGASIQQEFKGPNVTSDWAPCRASAQAPENTEHLKEREHFAPESLYKSEFRLPVMADCDNVTRFLMAAGYRAIVPGREDFIYSATWLRRIAALMKGASDPALVHRSPFKTEADRIAEFSHEDSAKPPREWKNQASVIESQGNKLHMLAANLRVTVVDPDDKTKKTSCPLLFADDLAPEVLCVKGENAVTQQMDWLRRTDQSLRRQVAESLTRQAESTREFNTQLIENQQAILNTLVQGYKDQLSPDEQATLSDIASCTFDPTKPASKPEPNFGKTPKSCKELSLQPALNSPAIPRDSLFAVAEDLIDKIHADDLTTKTFHNVLLPEKSRGYIVPLLLHLIYQEQKNIGYTIADLPNGKHAVVIGVVGTETMQEISHDYFTLFPDDWDCHDPNPDLKNNIVCRNKPEFKVKEGVVSAVFPPSTNPKAKRFDLSVGDPRFAVTTLLRAAWAEKLNNPKDADIDFVIVMAQMPHTEADELGAHVRGDIEQWYTDKRGIHLDENCEPKKPCIEKNKNGIYVDENGAAIDPPPAIDLILSEAQQDHETPTIEIALTKGEDTRF